jgi:hypothetical protein
MISLEKIRPTAASTILVCVSSFAGVEFMIFLLSRNLFMTMDFARLSCIGLGITSPLLILNAVFYTGTRKKPSQSKVVDSTEKDEREKITWSVSAAITILIVSFFTLIGFTYHFSLYRTLWIIFWFELFFNLMVLLSFDKKELRSPKSNIAKES